MRGNSDQSNLYQILLDFPSQIGKALAFAKNVKANGLFNKVIISGIGGSALPGDLVKLFIDSEKVNLPVIVNRSYSLPNGTDNQSLIFISSYSGNTEEPLSVFEETRAKKLNIVGFAKGGKLLELCHKNNIPCVTYPDDGPDFQPRYAPGYAFASMLSVLVNSKLAPDRLIKLLEQAEKYLGESDLEKRGEELAGKIQGKIPLVYASEKYYMTVARIIKIKFNESAKTQSFFNAFPELNHNEMVGFTNLVGKYYILIFKDNSDHPQIQKRMDITAHLLREKGVEVIIIEMDGSNTIEKALSSIYLGDWAAYHLAMLNKVDPTPVAMVEEFKKKLI